MVFGNTVVLYGKPLQKGMSSGSHFGWPRQGNTRQLSPKMAEKRENLIMFAANMDAVSSALHRG